MRYKLRSLVEFDKELVTNALDSLLSYGEEDISSLLDTVVYEMNIVNNVLYDAIMIDVEYYYEDDEEKYRQYVYWNTSYDDCVELLEDYEQNGIDVTNVISSLTMKSELAEAMLIGNVISREYTISVNNSSGFMNDKINGTFKLYEDSSSYIDEEGEIHYVDDYVLIDTLTVYEAPQLTYSTMDLTMYDNIQKTSVALELDPSLYPMTIETLLGHISDFCNLTIDYSNVNENVLKMLVNAYDTTLAVRSHLAWIAELTSANVYVDETGVAYFDLVNTDMTPFEIEDDDNVYSFKTSDEYIVGEVAFDNGIRVAHSGDEDNVYYLSTDNIYITDYTSEEYSITVEEIVNNIYEQIKGLTFTSVSSLDTKYIQNLKCGNMLRYKDYFTTYVTSIETTYVNGVLASSNSTIGGEMNNQATQLAVELSNSQAKKMLQVEFNQIDTKLSIIAEDTEENTSKITEIEQDVEQIQATVTNKVGVNNLLLNSGGWKEISSTDDVKIWNIVEENAKVEANIVNDFTRDYTISKQAFKMSVDSENDTCTMYQDVELLQNNTYTFSIVGIKNVVECSCYIYLIENDEETNEVEVFNIPKSDLNETKFDYSIQVYTTDVTKMRIKLKCSNTTPVETESDEQYLIISDMMLNSGNEANEWCCNSDETYTTAVKVDINGIEVSQNDSKNKTIINSQEFKGTYNDETVFSLNGETTQVKKLRTTSDMIIGNIHIYVLDNGIGFTFEEDS